MQIVAGTVIVSGALVLLGWFTLPVRIATLVALAILAWRSRQPTTDSRKQGDVARRSAWGLKLLACSSAALAAALLLWHSGTTDPIRSPWSVVPVPFFFLYAMLAMMMVVSTVRSSLLTSYFLLLTSSLVAILVYPLGFGFDHFIHAAAERIIATTGALSPPPFFYSGHYGLTVLLADLLPGVGVDLADRLLTPLLVIIFLVPLAYRALHSVLPERAARLGLSSLLIVPFLPLAVSTPQATANVFAIATVLLLMRMRYPTPTLSTPPIGSGSPEASSGSRLSSILKRRDVRGWATVCLTALAALLSQPMTGIITIAIVAMASAQTWWTKKTRSYFFGPLLPSLLTMTVAAVGVVAIPLAFAIVGRIIPNLDLRVTFDPLPALQRLSSALRDTFAITAMDFATADALAVVHVLLPIIWVGLAITGALARNVTMFPRSLKHGDTAISVSYVRSSQPVLMLILAPLIALAAAALVAATVTIPTQLGEEQSQFPLRLVQLAALLATPLAAIGLGTLLDRVRGRLPQTAAAIAVGAAATFTLLLAYPRDDAQARSGLWSVSADDIAAVHAIAGDAGDVPYVVLANQMLGAAAVREFGFRPSTVTDRGELMSFPLPAGGPIARRYWEFVNVPEPSRAPIDVAMDLVTAQRAYVVVHDYWRNYERIATVTAAIADAEVGQFSHLRIFCLTRRP